jgi:putative ferrous iron transport protein C
VILSDIKRYLQERGQASLQDIALHFDAEPEAVRGMLEQWVRKGRVERMMLTDNCGSSCSKCNPSGVEYYLWVDPNRPRIASIGQGCPSGS